MLSSVILPVILPLVVLIINVPVPLAPVQIGGDCGLPVNVAVAVTEPGVVVASSVASPAPAPQLIFTSRLAVVVPLPDALFDLLSLPPPQLRRRVPATTNNTAFAISISIFICLLLTSQLKL